MHNRDAAGTIRIHLGDRWTRNAQQCQRQRGPKAARKQNEQQEVLDSLNRARPSSVAVHGKTSDRYSPTDRLMKKEKKVVRRWPVPLSGDKVSPVPVGREIVCPSGGDESRYSQTKTVGRFG